MYRFELYIHVLLFYMNSEDESSEKDTRRVYPNIQLRVYSAIANADFLCF